MQMTIVYAAFAATVWLLVGITVTGLFAINRPKGITFARQWRLWVVGPLLWPYLVALMFDRR